MILKMKRYTFKLEKILKLKRIKENQTQKKLGEELREMNIREAHLSEAVELKSAFDHRFHEVEREGRIDPIFFRRYKSYQSTLGRDILRQEDACSEQNSVVDEARAHLQLARRKTQVFEKLEEVGRTAYWGDVRKEDQKIMSEVALQRFRRNNEQGKALLLLLAIGASGFVMGLLWLALLFGVGSLNAHRLSLIGQILRYRGDQWEGAVRVVGDENPHLITKKEFDDLKKDAQAWREEQLGDVDADVVITKEVLDQRRGYLELLQNTVARVRDETVNIQDSLKKQENDLQTSKKVFEEEKIARKEAMEDVSKKQKDKAQEEMLASFKSMDPEDVVKVLTGGVNVPDFTSEEALQGAVMKVSDYLSKMGARQRAGILQALTPEWAKSVVKHLEEHYPL
jgi:flagellar export protein FliJ